MKNKNLLSRTRKFAYFFGCLILASYFVASPHKAEASFLGDIWNGIVKISDFSDKATSPDGNSSSSVSYGIAETRPYFETGQEANDIVGVKYKFKIANNDGLNLKLIFGFSRLKGSGSDTYLIESNIYNSKVIYSGTVCASGWEKLNNMIIGQSTLRIAVPDYIKKGKTGLKTSSALYFPRITYLIDDIADLYKTEVISQDNLNGKEGVVEIFRGDVISDKNGWKCNGVSLDSDIYRQWNVKTTIGTLTYQTSIALPESGAKYLTPYELINFQTEFFQNAGLFKVYLWGFKFKRESKAIWEPLTQWKVSDYDGNTSNYGIRKTVYNGNNVIEISNDDSLNFLAKNETFELLQNYFSSSSSLSSSSSSTGAAIYKGLKSYVSYGSGGVAEDYHTWEGELTALFSKEKFLDDEVKEVLKYTDTCFDLYQKFGMRDWPLTVNEHFGSKGTLAIVDKTCGAGCGAGGKAEIQIDSFNSGRNNMGTIVHPHVWTVGYYEFGRQGGLAFPFYKALHHVPSYLTSAFPEFISSTCRRYLGLSDIDLKEITESSVLVYKENYDKIGLDFESFQNLDKNNITYQSTIFNPYKVDPGKLLTSLLYYLHKNNGEDYMKSFFSKAKTLQDNGKFPKNSHETACQILNIATSVNGEKSGAIRNYLINEWKFPNDCSASNYFTFNKKGNGTVKLYAWRDGFNDYGEILDSDFTDGEIKTLRNDWHYKLVAISDLASVGFSGWIGCDSQTQGNSWTDADGVVYYSKPSSGEKACFVELSDESKQIEVDFTESSSSSSSSSSGEISASPNPATYSKSATLTWTAASGPGDCYLYSPTDNLKTIKSTAFYLDINSASRFYKGPGYYATVARNASGATANLTTATDYTLTCDIETLNNTKSYELKVDITDSKKFIIGDLVYATDNVNVRDTSSLLGVILGRQSFGSLGKVVGGPVRAGSYSWWKIDYNNAPDGWSAEIYLEKRNNESSSSSSISSSSSSGAVSETFGYTGIMNKYLVPNEVTSVNIKAYGAQGDGQLNSGGKGGFAEANVSVTPGETLYIYVGGQKGWNGGGSNPWGYNGGGASDVRRGGMALSDRIIVAGGGGGSGTRADTYYGGSGGGFAGEDGSDANGASGGRGASNLTGGIAGSTGGYGTILNKSTFGILGAGGNGGFNNCSSYGGGGGGGGGYYGGGGGGGQCAGGAAGGGGSSFVPKGGTTLSNSRQGDGQVVITPFLPISSSSSSSSSSASSKSSSSSSQSSASDGPVASYKFNEGSGVVASDDSGNGNKGTISGARWAVGKIGNGLSFDGIDDYIDLGNSTSLQPDKISLSAWFKTDSSGGMIIRKRLYGYGLEMLSSGKISFWIYNSSAAKFSAVSPNVYNDGQWHHAVGIYDGSTAKLYIDGSQTASTIAGKIYYGAGGIAIGRDGNYNISYFKGVLDEVKIYNRALNGQEALAIYNKEGGSSSSAVSSSSSSATTTSPSITVISPNGGEIWEEGKEYVIKWKASNLTLGSKIRIILNRSGGSNKTIIENILPDEGIYQYLWKADTSGEWGFGYNQKPSMLARLFGVNAVNAEGGYSIGVGVYGKQGEIAYDKSDESFNIINNSSSSSSFSSAAEDFTAYNDLSWSAGQVNTNITLYTTGQNGLLKDYFTGTNTSVTLTIAGGNVSSGNLIQGSNANSGTDADTVFNSIVNSVGLISYSGPNLTFTFTGLDSNLNYEFVLFGNRNSTSYTNRTTTAAISDVVSFTNASTGGATFSGETDPAVTIVNGHNTVNGYVARFANIKPGADGDMLITVSSPTGQFYANALMLRATQLPASSSSSSSSSSVANNLSNGLIAQYRFDDGNANDSYGNNNGSVFGAVSSGGIAGGALSFDGNDYVQINGLLNNPANVTISAWANLTSSDTNGAEIISLGNYVGLRLQDPAESFGVSAFYRYANGWRTIKYGVNYAGTGWHHFAYVVNDAANSQKLYVDGALASTTSYADSIQWTGQGSDTFIGKHGNSSNTNYDFNGLIDETKIYNRALTAEEVSKLYSLPGINCDTGGACAMGYRTNWLNQIGAVLESIGQTIKQLFTIKKQQ